MAQKVYASLYFPECMGALTMLFLIQYDSALTSVGHEYFQTSILQQVTSGKHSSDLTEHPFPMQPLRVRQDLNEEHALGALWRQCSWCITYTPPSAYILTPMFIFREKNTHLCISLLESRIVFIHLKVNLSGGDGERPPGNDHRSDQLGRRAQNYRTLERPVHLLHLLHIILGLSYATYILS